MAGATASPRVPARPVDVTVPDTAAEPVLAAPEFALTVGGNDYSFGRLLDT